MDDYYEKDPWKTALMLCSIVTGIALLLVLFLVPWPRDASDWLGDTSPVAAVGMLLTPLGAIAALLTFGWNVRNSNRTLQQAVKNEQATRFQTASEMLASPTLPVAMAGATLLTSIAEQDPESYLNPVIEILSSTATMLNSDWTTLYNASEERHTLTFPLDKPLVNVVLGRLAALNERFGWPRDLLFDGLFPISSVYYAGSTVTDLKLPHIIGVRWIFDQQTAYKCDFRGSALDISVGEQVSFKNCDLSNANLTFRDYDGLPFRGGRLPGRLSFIDCNLNDTIVNGKPYSDWLVAFTGRVETRRGNEIRKMK